MDIYTKAITMLTKQKISDKLQAKFNKPQFQIGAAVLFSWLGQKQYGYVTKTKQSNWGVQYTVESIEGLKYPCGIQIQGQKTQYHTGFILFEDGGKFHGELVVSLSPPLFDARPECLGE